MNADDKMIRALRDELDSLRPGAAASGRRGFVVTALGTGFAASVMPTGALRAQAITTDASGLAAGEVKIPAAGGDMPAYRAMPATGAGHPVLLVVQEIFGVHEHIKDVCRRFAKLGYLAIAPELFARQGDPSKYTSVPELFKDVVSKVPDSQVIAAAQLRGLDSRIGAILAKGDVKLDDYSRAHLVEIQARIKKVLDASVTLPRL